MRLRVVPNAKRNAVIGEYGDAIKVKIAAPALDGKANEAVRDFLATTLGVPGRSVTLISGEKSRDKVVAVEDLDAATQRQRLLAAG